MFFSTSRTDQWWLGPLLTALALGLFGVYSLWAAFQGEHYSYGPYLSPFYSPLFVTEWWKFSPAFLILWAPLGFRATCYYYRKAYYRAFFLDPVACAVGEGKTNYQGETAFPFIVQNLHRYFLYLALIFIVILWTDVVHAFSFDGKFGMGLGTLVLFLNSSLLSLYTFSCHSLRHLVGGRLKCFSTCAKLGNLQHETWKGVSCLNRRHMLWAWLSLFMVGFSDLYIRLVSMGIITDVRFF